MSSRSGIPLKMSERWRSRYRGLCGAHIWRAGCMSVRYSALVRTLGRPLAMRRPGTGMLWLHRHLGKLGHRFPRCASSYFPREHPCRHLAPPAREPRAQNLALTPQPRDDAAENARRDHPLCDRLPIDSRHRNAPFSFIDLTAVIVAHALGRQWSASAERRPSPVWSATARARRRGSPSRPVRRRILSRVGDFEPLGVRVQADDPDESLPFCCF